MDAGFVAAPVPLARHTAIPVIGRDRTEPRLQKAPGLYSCIYVFSHMPPLRREKRVNMTFSVPERLRRKAQARADVNWSAVVAQAIEERLVGLEILDKIATRTHLSEKDVEELADLVDTAMAQHFGVHGA